MQLIAPLPGDIIIQATQYSVVPHAIIWIGDGERCIAEASDGSMNGVRLATRKEFELAQWADSLPYSTVFRCKDQDIAKAAAECARKWGTVSSAESHIHKGMTNAEVIKKGERALLPTPYRMRGRNDQKSGPWTPTETLFSMARAYVRDRADMPLSINQGMGCAGFVTYCYQVASLKVRFGNDISNAQMKLMAEFVVLKNAANVAWIAQRSAPAHKELSDREFLLSAQRKQEPAYATAAALKAKVKGSFNELADSTEGKAFLGALPKEVLRDAKSTRTVALLQDLEGGGNFECKGYLVGNGAKNASTKVGIVARHLAPKLDTEMAKFNAELSGWI